MKVLLAMGLSFLVALLAFLVPSCGRVQVDEDPIQHLYATKPEGRTWVANWSNGEARELASGQRDRFDPLVRARGNGRVNIDGAGTATLNGSSPRVYVYDEAQALAWGDVEITVYGRRGSETSNNDSQGLVIGGRSEHQDTNADICAGQTYYGRLLFDGRVGFQKELVHHEIYSSHVPAKMYADWSAFGGSFPRDVWIGLKYVIRTLDPHTVALELYRDLTGGHDGGDWELVAAYEDTGTWTEDLMEEADRLGCESVPPVFTDPATSIFIRNDDVASMSYKDFSIREIDPLERLD